MATDVREEIGRRNRQRVLEQILQHGPVSRTEISNALDLNAASISRITRDLIDANLVSEHALEQPETRRGRRFVGLAPRDDGGYVIGVGINAFRQSVTLADLGNNKVSEWISLEAAGGNGEVFLRTCLEQAGRLLDESGIDRRRFFGVGMTLAGHLDKAQGRMLSAPTLGWADEVDIAALTDELLGAPLVLDTPSAAINLAEADFGIGQGYADVMTLHCSLGFGVGIRKRDDNGVDKACFGNILTQTPFPFTETQGRPQSDLSGVLGGDAVLMEVLGAEHIRNLEAKERGDLLVDLIDRANAGEQAITDVLERKGYEVAQAFAILIAIVSPQLVILAGPLTQSPAFCGSFTRNITVPGHADEHVAIEVKRSDMTHIGAARWLSIRGNVALGPLDLVALSMERIN